MPVTKPILLESIIDKPQEELLLSAQESLSTLKSKREALNSRLEALRQRRLQTSQKIRVNALIKEEREMSHTQRSIFF